jgi:hypothetical protein
MAKTLGKIHKASIVLMAARFDFKNIWLISRTILGCDLTIS